MSLIECPYCDEQNAVSDAWELGEGEHIVQCESCEKEFIAEGEITLEFSSSRINCGEGKHKFEEWDRNDYTADFYDRVSVRYKELCGEEICSRWKRECENCDEIEISEKLPLYSPLPDHLKEG